VKFGFHLGASAWLLLVGPVLAFAVASRLPANT
jgi:hypothetical protein